MPQHHLVRVGAFGQVLRFAAVDLIRYPRGARVIVRTSRGLEVGEVLAAPMDFGLPESADGELLRGMTAEDELLEQRLQRHRTAAFEACLAKLAEAQITTPLIEIEQLFDGRTLVFHFLGPSSATLDQITHELAEAYDARAQIRHFATTLSEGCGPDCGSEHATGQGCTHCGVGCAIATACAKSSTR